MGNSSSMSQTYQQMTPAQQHAMWMQYQRQTSKLHRDIKNLSSRQSAELSKIQQIENDLKKQFSALSPMNSGNNLDIISGAVPYSAPMNQQPVNFSLGLPPIFPQINQPTPQPPINQPYILPTPQTPAVIPPTPSVVPPTPSVVPPTPSVVPVPSVPVSSCVSTANGGICSLTIQAPTSSGSTCRFVGQSNGSLVIYNSAGRALWVTSTSGKGIAPFYLTALPTGNVTWTDSTGAILWQTDTAGKGIAPYTFSMNPQCNAQLTDSTNAMLWQSNTNSN